MENIKLYFYNEEEKQLLLEEYKLFSLIEVAYTGGKQGYILFKNNENIFKLTSLHQDKISILEAENQALREELTQIQTSIASLTSLITTTLEEK